MLFFFPYLHKAKTKTKTKNKTPYPPTGLLKPSYSQFPRRFALSFHCSLVEMPPQTGTQHLTPR